MAREMKVEIVRKSRELHVEILRGKSKRRPWHIVLVGANGEKMVTSQGYTRVGSARRSAARVFPALPVRIRRP